MFSFLLIISWMILTLYILCLYTFIYFNSERSLSILFFFFITLTSIHCISLSVHFSLLWFISVYFYPFSLLWSIQSILVTLVRSIQFDYFVPFRSIRSILVYLLKNGKKKTCLGWNLRVPILNLKLKKKYGWQKIILLFLIV